MFRGLPDSYQSCSDRERKRASRRIRVARELGSRPRSPDFPHEPERLPHQSLHAPAFVDRRMRIEPVLQRVPVAAGRARSGGAAVHTAMVFAAHGGRQAGMAGAGRRAAAPARQHRLGVTRASHLCARAAPGPARSPAGSAASSACRRARAAKSPDAPGHVGLRRVGLWRAHPGPRPR
jgi:hypothetical protein